VKGFNGNILFLFSSNCSKYLRLCSSLEIVHCAQDSDLIYMKKKKKKGCVDLSGTGAPVSIKLNTMLAIVLN
jgi:hypothetical protein